MQDIIEQYDWSRTQNNTETENENTRIENENARNQNLIMEQSEKIKSLLKEKYEMQLQLLELKKIKSEENCSLLSRPKRIEIYFVVVVFF